MRHNLGMGQQPHHDADLQRQVDEIRAGVARNRAAIEALETRADAADQRAEVDRALIEELKTEGMVSQAQVEDLRAALHTSRTIEAALGIVMANRRVTEVDAFKILAKASQDRNRKLRVIADDIVATGDVAELPGA